MKLRRQEAEGQWGGRTEGRGGCGLQKGFRHVCFCLESILKAAFAGCRCRTQMQGPGLRLGGILVTFDGYCEISDVRRCLIGSVLRAPVPAAPQGQGQSSPTHCPV